MVVTRRTVTGQIGIGPLRVITEAIEALPASVAEPAWNRVESDLHPVLAVPVGRGRVERAGNPAVRPGTLARDQTIGEEGDSR
jgi:hypothetical protein